MAPYDVVLRSGTLIDGTGAPSFQADLGFRGDRIARIGNIAPQEGRVVLDVQGRWVTPGFVDAHTHMDGWLLKTPLIESKLRQGFTTEVIMADGISYAPVSKANAREWIAYLRALNALQQADYAGWESVRDYMQRLDGANAQNVMAQIPYANVRVLACGWAAPAVDDFQMSEIQLRIERGLDEGACGLSTGLDYIAQCFASTRELEEACAPVAARNGIYATHVRYKKGTLQGVKEAVRIGSRTGVKVHISHLKGNTERERDELLAYIDREARQEADFSFDVYPYLPGSSMLNYLLPYAAFRDGPLGVANALRTRRFRDSLTFWAETRLDLAQTIIAWTPGRANAHWQGQTLQAYVAAAGRPAGDALCDFLIEEDLAVLLVFHRGDDRLVEDFLRHPCFMLGTDGILHEQACVHPRQYGSAPRMLDTLVTRGVLSREEAVHKMSGKPAARFGLKQRGTLAAGQFADVAVIDPAAFKERNGYREPAVMAAGLEFLWVNGQAVIDRGQLVAPPAGARYPGRALAFNA